MSDTVPIEIDPPMTAVTVMRDRVRMLEYIVRLKNATSQGPHGLTPEQRARVIRRTERELVIVRETLPASKRGRDLPLEAIRRAEPPLSITNINLNPERGASHAWSGSGDPLRASV
jgi:tryptophan 2,3-dioxygenase